MIMKRFRNRAFMAAAFGLLLAGGATLSGQSWADDGSVTETAPPPPPAFCKVIEAEKPKGKDQAAAQPGADAASPDSAAAAAAAAAKPKIKLLPELKAECADGKVKLVISSRFYGWQVGDGVPLNFRFLVPEGVKINTDTLMQGKLIMEKEFKTAFEMVSKPVVKTAKKDGVTEYDVTIEVRQFTFDPITTFSMQFPYAVEFAPDGAPKWKVFTTPPYLLTNNVDGGYQDMERAMTMGNTELVKPRTPWAVPALTVVIVLLLLTWPAILLMRRVNRTRPRKNISREAAAWLAMHSAVKSGKEIGFGTTHYRRMDEVLRKFLGTTYAGLEGMTMSEIEMLPEEPRAATVKSIFRKLDRALITGRALNAAEQTQLLKEVDELIKRPYTM